MDQSMPGGFNSNVTDAIMAGDVSAARIDDALTRILTPLITVGVFDRKDYGNRTAGGGSLDSCSALRRHNF